MSIPAFPNDVDVSPARFARADAFARELLMNDSRNETSKKKENDERIKDCFKFFYFREVSFYSSSHLYIAFNSWANIPCFFR